MLVGLRRSLARLKRKHSVAQLPVGALAIGETSREPVERALEYERRGVGQLTFTDGAGQFTYTRARTGKLRADALPLRLQRARAGRRVERWRHGHRRHRDGHAARGNGGGRGHARGTAIHRRLPGAHRRHHGPGFHQPGRQWTSPTSCERSSRRSTSTRSRSATQPPSCGWPTCCNMAPNHTLILVNGKRRHRAAVVA